MQAQQQRGAIPVVRVHSVHLQVAIAKHGLQTLLGMNYYFTEVLSKDGLLDHDLEQRLVWLCGGILSNIALHPNNRWGPIAVLNSRSHAACPPWCFATAADQSCSKHYMQILRTATYAGSWQS